MIFYFSGTGNSRYAAQQIAVATGDSTASIGEAMRKGRFDFELQADEAVGFVVPVYAWDLPAIAADFIEKLNINDADKRWVFAVFTCGGNIGLICDETRKALAKKGLVLRAAFDLVMPDNYVVLFNPPEEERQRKMLSAAEPVLERVAEAVKARENVFEFRTKNPPRIFSRVMSYFFNEYGRGTAKFHVTDACKGCALCERICPVAKISMKEGKPVWAEGKCAKCLACINRCPLHAIQHGKSTLKKKRYVHPSLRNSGARF